jgi:hypothetical protein
MVLKIAKTTRAILVSVLIYVVGILVLVAVNRQESIPVWIVAFDVGLVTGGLVAIYVGDGK